MMIPYSRNHQLTAWGERRSVAAWAADDRCSIDWPGENEADSSRKVAGSGYKTITSKWSKSAVPKTITDGIQWHTDFGMACGTVF
jgi:hypothetical protein